MVPICCKVSPYSGDPCRRKYGGAFKSGMLLPQRSSSWFDVVCVTCPASISFAWFRRARRAIAVSLVFRFSRSWYDCSWWSVTSHNRRFSWSMIRWQGISTRGSLVRANRLAVCPCDRNIFFIAIRQARVSLLMMYSVLWLPIRFKVFRAAATACSSIDVLCS